MAQNPPAKDTRGYLRQRPYFDTPGLFIQTFPLPFGDAAVEGGEGVGEDLAFVGGGVAVDEGKLVDEGLEGGGGFGKGRAFQDGEGKSCGSGGASGEEVGDGPAGGGAEGDMAAGGLVEGGFLEAELGGEGGEGEAGDAAGLVDDFAGGGQGSFQRGLKKEACGFSNFESLIQNMKDLNCFALTIPSPRGISPLHSWARSGGGLGSPGKPLPGAGFNFAHYDCLAVGGGEYKLVPRRPRKMVPISYAAKAKGISVQTIHNYIVADFLKTVERPTPFKWLIDLGELDALLAQTGDMEFWTPERTASYLKAKRREAAKARTKAGTKAMKTKKAPGLRPGA